MMSRNITVTHSSQPCRQITVTHGSQKAAGLNGTQLKLIAAVSMLIDHIGSIFFPAQSWMHFLGRIAMPVFAFCISEGYIHTHSRKKYLLRLGLFAVISELPFDLAFTGGIDLTQQNIMLTFALAVIALMLWDAIIRDRKPSYLRVICGLAAVAGVCTAAVLLGADYTFFGIGTVWIFYVTRNRALWERTVCGVGFTTLMRTAHSASGSTFGMVPLLFYNYRRGRGLKWLFYAFYPGHLLVLFLLNTLLHMPK